MSDNPLFDELRGVHEMIRRDLAHVTLLAEDAAGGAAPEEIRERVAALKSSSILWQLKLGCLRHCRFVEAHHGLEDRAIFPVIRRVDPELDPVVDKLESDHRAVAEHVHELEAAAAALDGTEEPDGRGRGWSRRSPGSATCCWSTSTSRNATSRASSAGCRAGTADYPQRRCTTSRSFLPLNLAITRRQGSESVGAQGSASATSAACAAPRRSPVPPRRARRAPPIRRPGAPRTSARTSTLRT